MKRPVQLRSGPLIRVGWFGVCVGAGAAAVTGAAAAEAGRRLRVAPRRPRR
jgi:hypothetical protein